METRRQKIINKVFNKNDIRNIGKLLLHEYETQENEYLRSFRFQVNCIDDTSYESTTLSLLDEGSILDIKKATSIEYYYDDFDRKRNVFFSIVNGETGEGIGRIIVRGEDSDWVNGVFTKLSEIVNAVMPQDHWLIKYRTLAYHVIALGFGQLWVFTMWYILNQIIPPAREDLTGNYLLIHNFLNDHITLVRFALYWLFPWLMGLTWANSILTWLLKMWPSIEFDFGPEHMKNVKIRRKRMVLVFTIGVLPIVRSIIGKVI